MVELIARRGWAFEKIGPFLRASAVFRYRSKFLDADNARLAQRCARSSSASCRPPRPRPPTLEVLDLLLSFETWSRLRREQGLTPKRAREVLETTVRRLVE